MKVERMTLNVPNAPLALGRTQQSSNNSWFAQTYKNFLTLTRSAFSVIQQWNLRYQQRNQLMEMSDHLLNDIGVTRWEMQKEVEKPFWKN